MLPCLASYYDFSLLLLFLILSLSILTVMRRKASTSPNSRLPPTPSKLPIIGNLHQMGSLTHRSLHALSKKHGNLMLLYFGRVPTIVASSADEAYEIMKTHDLTFASRPAMKMMRLLYSGAVDLSFAPYGEHWRQMRKLCVSHLFSSKLMSSFRLIREEEVDFMIEKVSSRASSDTGLVDMSEVLNSFSNDIVCRIVSGKFSWEKGRNEMFQELIEKSSSLMGEFPMEEYIPFLAWLDVFFGLDARAKRSANIWKEVLDKVIKDHADRSRSNRHGEGDFTDVLLSLQKDPNMDFSVTSDQIRSILMDMFFAGTDTTYLVMEWAMAELIRSSETMKKLQDEIRGIAAGKHKLGEEDIREMTYLKAVLKEALRLHPPAPLLVPRESMEDSKIGGYKIPKQTRVIINAWAIGRDPKFWEAPDEFRPERFIGSSVDFKGHNFQFIPFGAGRRICPAMKFAASNMEFALANLIHQFDWELPGGIIRNNLDMTEKPGLSCRRKQKLHLVANLHNKNTD